MSGRSEYGFNVMRHLVYKTKDLMKFMKFQSICATVQRNIHLDKAVVDFFSLLK